jgi:hypothetical protein
MQGVKGEAVVVYADPLTTQQMLYHRLSRRVNNMAVFLVVVFLNLLPCCLCNCWDKADPCCVLPGKLYLSEVLEIQHPKLLNWRKLNSKGVHDG